MNQGDVLSITPSDLLFDCTVENLYTNISGKVPKYVIGEKIEMHITVQDLRSRWVGYPWTAVLEYFAVNSDELKFKVNDPIQDESVDYVDGWGFATNLRTNETGSIALGLLKRS